MVELSKEEEQEKKMIIDWIFELGEKFKQRNLTVHIAIHYLNICYSKGMHKDQ